jgi:DNA replication and repair protein RecF
LVELIGQLNTVLFSPEDIALIAGAAEVRRRYLYITLSQVDHRYLRTLRRYQRVLLQRNALLRELRERPAHQDQIEYWDEQVVELGSEIVVAHLRALAFLNDRLAEVHPRLTNQPEPLRAVYRSSVELAEEVTALGERAARPEHEAVLAQVRERFAASLVALRVRERQQAVTLAGPHRDDVGFYTGDVDLRLYGSRGQQRTAALALKLAEVALMERYTDDRPVLLLDDVMSELDPRRRALLQQMVMSQDQVLLTATDLSFFSDDFLAQAQRFRVAEGTVLPDDQQR